MEVETSNSSCEHGLQEPSTPAKLRTSSILHTKDLDSQVQKQLCSAGRASVKLQVAAVQHHHKAPCTQMLLSGSPGAGQNPGCHNPGRGSSSSCWSQEAQAPQKTPCEPHCHWLPWREREALQEVHPSLQQSEEALLPRLPRPKPRAITEVPHLSSASPRVARRCQQPS